MGNTTTSIDLVALFEELRAEEAEYERRLATVHEDIQAVQRALEIAHRRGGGLTDAVAAPPLSPLVSPRLVANKPVRSGESATASTSNQPQPARVTELVRKVRGLTQIEALKRIAQHSDGIVRTIEAKPVFIKATLTKGNPKHVGSHLYHLLDDSPEFEKIAPGTFRWLPFQAADEKGASDQVGPRQTVLASWHGEATEVLAAGNPEGDATEQTQEPPPPERDGNDRVGTVLPG